jgi:uncharacterized phage protein (TIGR02220 family)
VSQSWCKVASNLDSHPKIRKARAMGREVFLFALRRNAEPNIKTPGRIPKLELEPWYVADQLMRTEVEAAEGVAACLRADLLRDDGDHFLIVGWDEEQWGREKSTDRVRKWREEQRTKQDETLRNVAPVSVQHDETHETARSEERRSDQRRGEEKRSETETETAAPPLVLSPVTKSKVKATNASKGATAAELATVRTILDRLSERSGVAYRGGEKHTRLIVARLRQGVTEWDMRRVIGYCAEKLQWQGNPKMHHCLRPETLFGPETIEKYLDAARSWAPGPPPEEEQAQAPPLLRLVSADEAKRNAATLTGPEWEEPSWMTTTTA